LEKPLTCHTRHYVADTTPDSAGSYPCPYVYHYRIRMPYRTLMERVQSTETWW